MASSPGGQGGGGGTTMTPSLHSFIRMTKRRIGAADKLMATLGKKNEEKEKLEEQLGEVKKKLAAKHVELEEVKIRADKISKEELEGVKIKLAKMEEQLDKARLQSKAERENWSKKEAKWVEEKKEMLKKSQDTESKFKEENDALKNKVSELERMLEESKKKFDEFKTCQEYAVMADDLKKMEDFQGDMQVSDSEEGSSDDEIVVRSGSGCKMATDTDQEKEKKKDDDDKVEMSPSQILLRERAGQVKKLEDEVKSGKVISLNNLPELAGVTGNNSSNNVNKKKKSDKVDVESKKKEEDMPRMEAVAIPRRKSPANHQDRIKEAVKKLKEGKSVDSSPASTVSTPPANSSPASITTKSTSSYILGSRSCKRKFEEGEGDQGESESIAAKIRRARLAREAKAAAAAAVLTSKAPLTIPDGGAHAQKEAQAQNVQAQQHVQVQQHTQVRQNAKDQQNAQLQHAPQLVKDQQRDQDQTKEEDEAKDEPPAVKDKEKEEEETDPSWSVPLLLSDDDDGNESDAKPNASAMDVDDGNESANVTQEEEEEDAQDGEIDGKEAIIAKESDKEEVADVGMPRRILQRTFLESMFE